MHSCLPQFYSLVLRSCFSHEPALVRALLISKRNNTISLLGLCKSYHINSLVTPRNISVIFSFRCEVCSTLQGHFALPVYLQDFYFPFTPKHFFLDLESRFGWFRGRSHAAHPGSSAMPNPGCGSGTAAGTGPGSGHPSVQQRRLQPARPRTHAPRILGSSSSFGAASSYRRPWRVSVCSQSEQRGTSRCWLAPSVPGKCGRSRAALLGNGAMGWDQAKGASGEKVTRLAKDQYASSQFLCAKQDIWMLHHSADGVGWYYPDQIRFVKYIMKLLVC